MLLLAATMGLPACENPAGSAKQSNFTGAAVVVDQGGGLADEFEGEFDDGQLQAELSWSVVAPGRGRFGTQPPGLLLEFLRSCPGWQCPGYTSAGPSGDGRLSVAGEVHPVSAYVVRIGNRRSCGGCRIEYSLRVSHPAGSMRARPVATCPAFNLTFPSGTGPTPVIDPGGSPPQVRMRVGERVLMAPLAVGCGFTPRYHVLGFTVTDPAVAAVDDDGVGPSVFLRAERQGQTRVLADIAYADGSRVQGELGHCAGADASCTPTRLVLNVVR